MLDVSCIVQQFGLVVVDWSHRVCAMTFFFASSLSSDTQMFFFIVESDVLKT